ncbi:sirohydrochlorin chelatase [Flexivirga sp. ID2601S]|uniref:Sirohydrochlorin chelatase n=1 Tax=Flexivirga aerilata TaxID=1656889 RepID=A0A849AHM1_9MICO|nr:sirohydrochlorin chelatase [Flexivirga aerilata]
MDSTSADRPDHALVLVAHGTDNPAGRRVITDLRDLVAAQLPQVRVLDAYVDVQQPALDDTMKMLASEGIPTVVVPLLLSAGYHMQVDVADAVAGHPAAVAATSLGPHPLLAEVLADRLVAAGADRNGPVVCAVAGSARAEGALDAEQAASYLQEVWGGPVSVGYLSAATPSVAEALAGQPGAAVASYLIGPGFFHDRLRALDAVVTDPLGADARIAALVVDRYRTLAGR